jgi:hypothetical protein
MNLLTYRKPTIILCSDASEFGIGGYNIVSGQAWRLELPVDCRLRTSLNSLEFIACMVTIWVNILNGNIDKESCILSQTDSSTAAGWLKKSNFTDREDENVQLTTARQLGQLLIDSQSCLYSQWFPGDENDIADSLSRDFNIPTQNLTKLLVSSVLNQVPFGLEILPIPTEISLWLICMLRNQPQKEQWSKAPQRSKLSLGNDISNTLFPLELQQITTSTDSTNHKNIESPALLHMPLEKEDFVRENMIKSKLDQSEPPWIAWHRPTSWLTGQTQGSTLTKDLLSFYKGSSEATQCMIHHQIHKLQ